MNLISTLIFTCFCAYTALVGHRAAPLSGRQALDVLLTGALFTLPYLFMPLLNRTFTGRFSSRNTITFSQLALFLLMGAGAGVFCAVANGTAEKAVIGGLFCLVFLSGMICAVYRSALRVYIAETLPKKLLPGAGAVTESSTFAGIMAGVTGAAVAAGLDFHRGAAGVVLMGLAFISLSLATRLRPTLPPLPGGTPGTWFAVIRQEARGRELLLTGVGESYLFGTIIFAASLAVQYVSLNPGFLLKDPALEYAVMVAPLAGAGGGVILGACLCRNNAETGLVPPASLMMALASLGIGVLPLVKDEVIEGCFLGVLLLLLGFFAGIALVPLQAYQKFFVRKELRSSFFAWFYLPFGVILLGAKNLIN